MKEEKIEGKGSKEERVGGKKIEFMPFEYVIPSTTA